MNSFIKTKKSGQTVKGRTNLNGEYDICLPQEGEYLLEVQRNGFYPENANLTALVGQGSFKEIRLRPSVIDGSAPASAGAALKTGSVIVMDDIRYEANKATLNQKAVRHLDALFEIMNRYPEMQIDLIAHTDTRGDASDNLKLSSLRAENAKAYLVSRGIDEKRINAIGKGGSEPRNRCAPGVECSEAEHQFNVRFEAIVRRIGA